jgi:hypothetical protein
LTWQALRGQSIVHPDVWTLLAVGADSAFVGFGILASVTSVRRSSTRITR